MFLVLLSVIGVVGGIKYCWCRWCQFCRRFIGEDLDVSLDMLFRLAIPPS